MLHPTYMCLDLVNFPLVVQTQTTAHRRTGVLLLKVGPVASADSYILSKSGHASSSEGGEDE